MASIRITQFAGLMPKLSAKLKNKINAQIAHNCMLWDGRLQAMPAFHMYDVTGSNPLSLYRAEPVGEPYTPLDQVTGRIFVDYQLQKALQLDGPPFPYALFGLASGGHYGSYVATKFGPLGLGSGVVPAGLSVPNVVGTPTLTVTNTNQSQRPSVVSYAATPLRVVANRFTEEGPPVLIGTVGRQNSGSSYYDGDLVQINAQLTPFVSGEAWVNLYRTVTAIESGEQIVNTFDTDWYLVARLPVDPGTPIIAYTDYQPTEQILGDLLLSELFFPPQFDSQPRNVGLTESGWLWYASTHEVGISEKFKMHAWPPSGHLHIPYADTIVASTVFYDTIFLGTNGKPYKVSIVETNDDAIQVNASPYPEYQSCLPNTMVTAPFGALYTSPSGVVALEDNRMQVISRDLLDGGSVLYKTCDSQFSFPDITNAAWFNGWYIGYSQTQSLMFVYQPPEDLNDVHAFQQLVTMDSPTGTLVDWKIGDMGLQSCFGTTLYYWPVPSFLRPVDTATKLCYRWKSKRFVMPGRTNFGAAKVVHNCDGDVCFTLYSDCIQVYSRKVTDCNPFRLPSNYIGVEFEIELSGTGTVSEVHVASSIRELTEVETI